MPGATPFDTTPEADALQRRLYQRLAGAERIQIMFRLNEMVRRLTMAGIRARHPAYSNAQIQQAYTRLVLGDVMVRTVWPDDGLVDP